MADMTVEELVKRLRSIAETCVRPDGSQIPLGAELTEAADRIEAQAREIAEFKDELKQCRKEKNALVLKAYPAMDERDKYRAALKLISGQGQSNPEDPKQSEYLRRVLVQIAESALA